MFNINADGAKCLGCGVHFKGVQGRKVHQNKKFGSMGCRPIMVEQVFAVENAAEAIVARFPVYEDAVAFAREAEARGEFYRVFPEEV